MRAPRPAGSSQTDGPLCSLCPAPPCGCPHGQLCAEPCAASEGLAVRLWPPWPEPVKLLMALWGDIQAPVVSWRET